ncbi:MAG: hypothetical protein K8T25_18350 [Planctomycetia bacterium]|nr:hypothetical protein [Planctomycetia bacterium]
MAFDRYAACPCGTGKKIKFCCPDLVTELEQIHRLLEADQRLAALDKVRKARAAHDDRACLLGIECVIEAELGQEEQLAKTMATFEQKHPDNPVMLAELALHRADTSGTAVAGIEPLQRAIAGIKQEIPHRVFEVLGMLGQALLSEGRILAARAHLLLCATISGAEETSAAALLMRLNRATSVPLLLKQDYHFELPPEGFAHEQEFRTALDLAMRGAWLAAAARFANVARKEEDTPAVWHNLALVRAYVGDQDGAVSALRKLAALDVPADDAIEAAALAQLIDGVDVKQRVDILAATWPIEDAAALQSQLQADGRTLHLPLDPVEMAQSDQPPPQGAFRLLDRPMPESGVNLTEEAAPRILADLFVFGRETDRPPRLEVIAARGQELDAAVRMLADVMGRELGSPESEEVVRTVPAIQQALSWRYQLPNDTPPAKREELARLQQRNVLLELWPNYPNPVLGGKAPKEAAGDPAWQIRLSGAVLNLEQAAYTGGTHDAELFTMLRQQLGVAEPQPIDPHDVDMDMLPTVRLPRLEVEKLSDEQLLRAYQQASWLHYRAAILPLAAEVVRRPSLDEQADKAEAFGLLAQSTDDPVARMNYLAEARRVALSRNESCAPWDLTELATHLVQGNAAEAERLLHHLNQRHGREPGVAEALTSLLQRMGLLDPSDRMQTSALGAAASQPAAPAPSGLWTPDSPSAPAAAGAKKSVIWTPGS